MASAREFHTSQVSVDGPRWFNHRAAREWWRDVVAVHRLHFPLPLNYVVYALWGCFFAVDLGQVTVPITVLAMAANVLLIIGPLALNVAADVATDAQDNVKRPLSVAAGRLGGARVLLLGLGEMAGALVLVLVIGLVWTRWWPTVWALTVVVPQLAYNLEPVRLKRHGLAGSAVIGITPVGPPLLLSYTALNPHVSVPVWLVALGISAISTGRTIWWALPDAAADAATGMRTPPVRYGPTGALKLACVLHLCGIVTLGAGLWWQFNVGWCLLGIAGHVVFLAIMMRSLYDHLSSQVPNVKRLVGRTLPLMTLGDAMVAVVAIAA